jgi:nucleotide-binding universal stress UspA family protein
MVAHLHVASESGEAMEQTFLVGIDCSNCSQRALDYAASWAKTTGARLIVVHVIEWSRFSFSTPMENETRHKRREDELSRAQSEIIDPVVSKLREQGIEVQGLIRHGHAAETLSQLASEQGANNIIIGRKGASKLKTHLFGSVPNMLVQISEKPVTVVP